MQLRPPLTTTLITSISTASPAHSSRKAHLSPIQPQADILLLNHTTCHQNRHQSTKGNDRSWGPNQHHTSKLLQEPFPQQMHQSRQPNRRIPTTHRQFLDLTWWYPLAISQKFITDAQHTSQPMAYQTQFHILNDSTSLLILLSYATSDQLGILEFKVPNEAATSTLDSLTTQNKTAKHITFKTLIYSIS